MNFDKKGITLMIFGVILLLSAMGLFIYNNKQESESKKIVEDVFQKLKEKISDNIEKENKNTPLDSKDIILIDKEKYIGIISIPILGLKLPILNEWSYRNLKISPCRYKGNLYDNSLILLAHNYKNHFGTIDRLNTGDNIIFTDVTGNRYNYTVTEVKRLNGNYVKEMENGDWDLTLFTCTYGGKSRVTVRCTRDI